MKSDFRQLLVEEFGGDLADIRFEQRVQVKSRIEALIGRTVFEAKHDLVAEMRDVEHSVIKATDTFSLFIGSLMTTGPTTRQDIKQWEFK